MRLTVCSVLLLVVACGSPKPGPPAGTDAGAPDALPQDAAPKDGSPNTSTVSECRPGLDRALAYASPRLIPNLPAYYQLESADFNGDGLPDVVLAEIEVQPSMSSTHVALSLVLGQKGETFEAPRS
jgi:hypothetical protein